MFAVGLCYVDIYHNIINIKSKINNIWKTSSLTLSFPVFPFDPPENIRKPLVFWCFQGDQKETLGKNGLKYNILLTWKWINNFIIHVE